MSEKVITNMTPGDNCFFAMASLLEVAERLHDNRSELENANAEDEVSDVRGNIIHNLWRIAVKDYIEQQSQGLH